MRYTPVPIGDPIGWKPVNYLLGVGFTRDTWAHRIDIHAAIGRPMELDPAHDGRVIADIVREWAQLHAGPFDLHLTGTAGGTFSQGEGGERVETDALDFIRTQAGRLPGTGVMRHPLPHDQPVHRAFHRKKQTIMTATTTRSTVQQEPELFCSASSTTSTPTTSTGHWSSWSPRTSSSSTRSPARAPAGPAWPTSWP
ncbi:MAG: hypothetical protein WA991_05355 [Ornithinimicrobium sp.]